MRVTRLSRLHRNAPVLEGSQDAPRLRRRLSHRRHVCRGERAAVEQTGQTFGVVGVEVREHQDVHPTDAEVVQAPVDPVGIRTDVDDDRRVRTGRQDGRIPLTNVAEHGQPTGRWPRAMVVAQWNGHQPRRDRNDDDSNRQASVPSHGRRFAHGYRDHDHRNDREHERTGETRGDRHRRPRQIGPALCDLSDPPGEARRRCAGQVRQRWAQRRNHRRQHAEQRDGCDRRRDQQIRWNGHQAEPRVEQHHDRRGHELRRQRHGECRRDCPWDPAAPRSGPAWSERDQRQRGQRGQHEPVCTAQERIDE